MRSRRLHDGLASAERNIASRARVKSRAARPDRERLARCGRSVDLMGRRTLDAVRARDRRVECEAVASVVVEDASRKVSGIGRCVTRDGRREARDNLIVGQRRVVVTPLSRAAVKGDVLHAQAGARCCKTVGDDSLAAEMPFARLVGCVLELARERVERRVDEIPLSLAGRCKIEIVLVRNERDLAARRRLADGNDAALYRRRIAAHCMAIEHLRVTAVVVDRDVFRIFLEDDACVSRIAAAREPGHAAALPCLRCT